MVICPLKYRHKIRFTRKSRKVFISLDNTSSTLTIRHVFKSTFVKLFRWTTTRLGISFDIKKMQIVIEIELEPSTVRNEISL